jgi:TonB-dependent starch-binding outer membrane protein SusC
MNGGYCNLELLKLHSKMKIKIFLILIISFCIFQGGYADKPGKKITITGVVLDANKKPVPNVLIFVDKVRSSSTTDSKGMYRIKVSPEAKKIIIYSIGGNVGEMEINGQTVINFNLAKPNEISARPHLDEDETINIGYEEVKKKNLTMPVNKIDGKKTRYSNYNSIFEMISGEVPGVEVQGTSIKIRNAYSFYLSTEPLFVVDGIIVDKINDIVPTQVKSIEVLKGAAASTYGARGGNGVIVITLLSGRDR